MSLQEFLTSAWILPCARDPPLCLSDRPLTSLSSLLVGPEQDRLLIRGTKAENIWKWTDIVLTAMALMAERGSQRSLPPWNAQLLYPILMKSARYYWVADFVNINDSLEIVSITTIVASGISSHRLHSTELVDPEKQLILLPEAVTLAIIIPKSNSVLMQTCGWINSHPHTITNSTFDWFLFSWNSRCLIYHISNDFCPMWPIYVLYIYIYSRFPRQLRAPAFKLLSLHLLQVLTMNSNSVSICMVVFDTELHVAISLHP